MYIPKRHFPSVVDFFGNTTKDYYDYPVNLDLVKKYYQVVDNPEEADFAIVFIQGPMSGTGYDVADREKVETDMCRLVCSIMTIPQIQLVQQV